MKKEINASKTFVEQLAEAGSTPWPSSENPSKQAGIDLENDETPLQVAANALLRFERAHVQFVRGALNAASSAVGNRAEPREARDRRKENVTPKFHLLRM